MAKATDLISSLFDASAFQDVPFPQQLASWFYVPKLTYFFCDPFFSSLPRSDDSSYMRYGFSSRIVLTWVLPTLSFAWNVTQSVRRAGSKTKCSNTPWLSNTPALN